MDTLPPSLPHSLLLSTPKHKPLPSIYTKLHSFRGAPRRRGSERKPRVHRTHFPFPGTDWTMFPSALATREGRVPRAPNREWTEGCTLHHAWPGSIPSNLSRSLSCPPGREQRGLRRWEPYDGKEPDPRVCGSAEGCLLLHQT